MTVTIGVTMGIKTYHVKVVIVILWVVVHWGNVASLLVPVAVEVIGHDGDPVHVLVNGWHIIS